MPEQFCEKKKEKFDIQDTLRLVSVKGHVSSLEGAKLVVVRFRAADED
jgi:hypothetical protein